MQVHRRALARSWLPPASALSRAARTAPDGHHNPSTMASPHFSCNAFRHAVVTTGIGTTTGVTIVSASSTSSIGYAPESISRTSGVNSGTQPRA
jgi:hypothetical protein